jgi:hypothetical protein
MPLVDRSDELNRVLDQLRENLRNAEDLYEQACVAFEKLALPARPALALAAVSG